MLYAMLAACATLILVLAVPAKAHRLARLFRAQEVWAELMGRESQPRQKCPWRPRGVARARKTSQLSCVPRTPPWPSCFLDSLMANAEPEMPDDIAP